MLDTICQLGIIVFGFLSIFLVARKNKWGFVFGILAQPFWFITTYTNQQWGIFLLAIAYTVTWAYGIWEWFFKKEKQPSRPEEFRPFGPVKMVRTYDDMQRAVEYLDQQLFDAKQLEFAFGGWVTAEFTCKLLKALDRRYKSLGGQELRFQFTQHGVIAKPYDEPQE